MSAISVVFQPIEILLPLLESDDFYCDVAVASTPRAYYRRLASHPLVKQLAEIVDADRGGSLRILEYAWGIAKSVHGPVRSENDAALCACLVALQSAGVAGFDDLLSFLRRSKELGLKWASDVSDALSETRVSTLRTETVSGALGPAASEIFSLVSH